MPHCIIEPSTAMGVTGRGAHNRCRLSKILAPGSAAFARTFTRIVFLQWSSNLENFYWLGGNLSPCLDCGLESRFTFSKAGIYHGGLIIAFINIKSYRGLNSLQSSISNDDHTTRYAICPVILRQSLVDYQNVFRLPINSSEPPSSPSSSSTA